MITALLVVALATTVAVAMVERQQIDIRRTANLIHHDQAYLYAMGGESWARAVLLRDREQEQDRVDSTDEVWAQPLPPTVLEGGEVSGYIEDLQGRFNVNNLYSAKPQNPREQQRLNRQIELLRRLLQTLDLEPSLAHSIADWIDADAEQRFPDGAEDLHYLSLDPPYRCANGPIAGVSELRLVRGMDRSAYERLEPFVSALPTTTPINVNTARREVIQALSGNFDRSAADAIVQRRRRSAFASLDRFVSLARELGGQDALGGDPAGLVGVSSDYFAVHARVSIGVGQMRLRSTVQRRADGTSRVVRRESESL